MEFLIEYRDGLVIVHLVGDLESGRVVEFNRKLQEVLSPRPRVVIIDLARLGGLDSSGLGGLVQFKKAADSAGVKLILCQVPRAAMNLFNQANLDRLLGPIDSLTEAIRRAEE